MKALGLILVILFASCSSKKKVNIGNVINKIRFELVTPPFVMGRDYSYPVNRNPKQITVEDFYIDLDEITGPPKVIRGKKVNISAFYLDSNESMSSDTSMYFHLIK